MLRGITKPIPLDGVSCNINTESVDVSGKHGMSSVMRPDFIKCTVSDGSIMLEVPTVLTKSQKAMAGSFKANLVASMKGVRSLHERTVIFTGTGASVKVVGSQLAMRIGKSHPVDKEIPSGVTCKVESSDIRETRLKVTGTDAALIGQFASELCVKNPYKGGIHIWVEGKEVPLRKKKGQGKDGK